MSSGGLALKVIGTQGIIGYFIEVHDSDFQRSSTKHWRISILKLERRGTGIFYITHTGVWVSASMKNVDKLVLTSLLGKYVH